MTALFLEELPYCSDSTRLFEALVDGPWALFFDSAGQGRYDIFCAEPYATLVTRGPVTEVRTSAGVSLFAEDPFALLKKFLQPSPAESFLPFAGGAAGYFAYDLARRLERLPALAQDGEGLPEMALGLYDWAVVVDHAQHQAWLASHGRDPATARRWVDLTARFSRPPAPRARVPFRIAGPVRSNLSQARYAAAIACILDYIRAGDCYQVNFAQRFSAPAEGDPWPLYRRLRELNPAPFSAYLHFPFCQVLSASPERFLKVRAAEVETKPIKGTRPRSSDPQRDAALAQALKESPKDRAENVMIVDLLRNDLGKTCALGSVKVPKLFEVESFASVHHLVSTVTGHLAPGQNAVDLLRGCFPGGSVTGAPKLRAMEIIEELEPHRRGVYCGAIGYIGFDGAMDSNIAIRTMVYSAGTIRFWAGGGIVADSRVEEEYQETFDKAERLLKLLELTGVQHVE